MFPVATLLQTLALTRCQMIKQGPRWTWILWCHNGRWFASLMRAVSMFWTWETLRGLRGLKPYVSCLDFLFLFWVRFLCHLNPPKATSGSRPDWDFTYITAKSWSILINHSPQFRLTAPHIKLQHFLQFFWHFAQDVYCGHNYKAGELLSIYLINESIVSRWGNHRTKLESSIHFNCFLWFILAWDLQFSELQG